VRSVHTYGAHPSQHAELFRPEGRREEGVAVVIHGGFWRDRFDRHLMDGLCLDLAARGWAAWNLEYRRMGDDGGGWPHTFDDLRSGIAALGDVDDLPLTRVVTIGHSAGGHLALWAARECDSPTGAVSLAGVTDLIDSHRRGLSSDATGSFLGGSPAEVPDRYALASPMARLPIGVPVLLIHGDADEHVPVDLSISFARAATAAGDDVELFVGQFDYFDVIDPNGGSWPRVLDWLRA
jgi:acetyl esterase/lipase